MASLEGAGEYQVRSLRNEVAAFLFIVVCLVLVLGFFLFRLMHFKSFLTEIWEKALAGKHKKRKSKIVEFTKQEFLVVTKLI